MNAQQKQEQGRFKYKIIVVGDVGSGKTSLVHRYKTGVYEPQVDQSTNYYGDPQATKVLLIDGYSVEVLIHEPYGAERFRTIGNYFFRNARAVVFCCALGAPNRAYYPSNEAYLNSILQWQQEVERYTSKRTLKVLVGTKKDLVESSYHNGNVAINVHTNKNMVQSGASLSIIPVSLLHFILSCLHVKDISSCSQASRFWHSISNDELLWKNLVNSKFQHSAQICVEPTWKLEYKMLHKKNFISLHTLKQLAVLLKENSENGVEFPVYTVSAKNGSFVDQLFEEVAKKLLYAELKARGEFIQTQDNNIKKEKKKGIFERLFSSKKPPNN